MNVILFVKKPKQTTAPILMKRRICLLSKWILSKIATLKLKMANNKSEIIYTKKIIIFSLFYFKIIKITALSFALCAKEKVIFIVTYIFFAICGIFSYKEEYK